MSSKIRWAVLAVALVGFGLATASMWVHYRLLTDPTYVSPCEINATFSCAEVYLSRYGSIHGVPVALGGVVWFALVAMLAGAATPDDRTSAVTGYLFVLATVGLAVVLNLAYVSFFVLRVGCPLCLGTYVCVVTIFALSSFTTTVPMTRLPRRLPSDLRTLASRPAALAAIILFLAGAASVAAFFPGEGSAAAAQAGASEALSADAQTNFASAWAQQPRVDLGIPANGAKVIIVKFNDYECPSCRQAEVYYKPILEKFAKSNPGAVTYVVKDWPWNSACNFNVSTIHGHEAACNASAAARMAKDRGKYEAMVDWLWANQGTTAAAVRDAATRILGVTDFDKEYSAKLTEIRRDVADGGVLRINSTPTFFINGVRMPDGIVPAPYFELAITLELKRAG
jgi:uncharacterized membrane protein/thiol-disulfide isomerase/thioredoxin